MRPNVFLWWMATVVVAIGGLYWFFMIDEPTQLPSPTPTASTAERTYVPKTTPSASDIQVCVDGQKEEAQQMINDANQQILVANDEIRNAQAVCSEQ